MTKPVAVRINGLWHEWDADEAAAYTEAMHDGPPKWLRPVPSLKAQMTETLKRLPK